ncbi:MAG: CARDB domain-containing protein [Halobacteriales archaeon]|nr:CARDB domain-containing protein [Halobacteriales archaeon]
MRQEEYIPKGSLYNMPQIRPESIFPRVRRGLTVCVLISVFVALGVGFDAAYVAAQEDVMTGGVELPEVSDNVTSEKGDGLKFSSKTLDLSDIDLPEEAEEGYIHEFDLVLEHEVHQLDDGDVTSGAGTLEIWYPPNEARGFNGDARFFIAVNGNTPDGGTHLDDGKYSGTVRLYVGEGHKKGRRAEIEGNTRDIPDDGIREPGEYSSRDPPYSFPDEMKVHLSVVFASDDFSEANYEITNHRIYSLNKRNRDGKQDTFIDITGSNSPVTEGDTLEVEAEIENTGEEEITNQNVNLSIDDAGVVDTVNIPNLAKDESTNVTLEWTTKNVETGAFNATVSTPSDSDSTNVGVVVDGFSIDIIDTNPPIEEGDSLEVKAQLKNTGKQATQDVKLSFNDVVDTKSLKLAEDESENVTLEGVVRNASGIFTATVSTEDNNETAKIDLLEYIAGSAASDSINLIARSDLNEPITVGVGETVAIGFPREEDSGNVTEQPGNYSWRVHEFSEGNTNDGQLLYTDKDDLPDQPDIDEIDFEKDARATSFRPEEPGRYVIELETDKDVFSDDSVGGETVGHTAVIEVKRTGDKELLDRHSPVLKFHPDEEYYPTRLEAIFDNSYLCRNEEIVHDSATLYDIASSDELRDDSDLYLQPYHVAEKTRSFLEPSPGPPAPEPHEECDLVSMSFEEEINEGFNQYNPDTSGYPRTVHGAVKKNVSFNALEPEAPHVSNYVEAGFGSEIPSESSDSYTALVYITEYVNDPKPENARGKLRELIGEVGGEGEGFDEVAAHTGDGSVIVVLVDENEEPQWVLAQQHLGGEFRLWEHVETTSDGKPVMYIAEGAHTSFFGPVTQGQDRIARSIRDGIGIPRYTYQQQYLANGRGDTTIAEFLMADINGYVDHITDDRNNVPAGGEVWARENDDFSGNIKTYEIAVLDSEEGEGWSDYSGDIYTYPRSNPPVVPYTKGSIPQQGIKWDDPGEWADDRAFADMAETGDIETDGPIPKRKGSGQINARFPSGEVVAAVESVDTTDVELPEDFDLISTTGGVIGLPIADPVTVVRAPPFVIGNETPSNGVAINIINNGMQPHEFNLHLKNDDDSTGVDYSFYANSIYPNNLVGADNIQLDEIIEEQELDEGTFAPRQDIEASLAAYPTTDSSDPGDYVFDERTIAAGGISLPPGSVKKVPRMGKGTVRVDPLSDGLSPQAASSDRRGNVTPTAEIDLNFGRGNTEYVESVTLDVEGEEPVTVSSPLPSEPATERDIQFLSPTSAPDSKPKMRFRVPAKNETGEFNVSVSVEYTTGDVVDGTLEDYLVYLENDEVDTLAKLDADTKSEEYYAGNKAEISATVLGTSPVNDATVEAEVTKPNGSTETVGLERTGEGVYTGLLNIGQNVTRDGVRGEYNATVTASVPGGVTREDDVSWEVGFNSPVGTEQTEVPSVLPGEVAQAEIGTTSVAGARSVELGISNLRHDDGDEIISTEGAIRNTSHIVTQDEEETVSVPVSIPPDAEPGTYTGEVGTVVTDSEAQAIEKIWIEVEPEREEFDDEDSDSIGGVGNCVPRRSVSRGEEDERCPGRRDFGRGEDENSRDDFDTDGKRNSGRSRGEDRGG